MLLVLNINQFLINDSIL